MLLLALVLSGRMSKTGFLTCGPPVAVVVVQNAMTTDTSSVGAVMARLDVSSSSSRCCCVCVPFQGFWIRGDDTRSSS